MQLKRVVMLACVELPIELLSSKSCSIRYFARVARRGGQPREADAAATAHCHRHSAGGRMPRGMGLWPRQGWPLGSSTPKGVVLNNVPGPSGTKRI